MTALTFVLLCLASYRLTRLVVKDDITEPMRQRITVRWVRDLWTCHWCASVWVSAFVVFTARWFTPIPVHVLVWGAVAAVAGLISEHLDDG